MKVRRRLYTAALIALLFAALYTGYRVLYILFFTAIFLLLFVLGLNLYTIYTFRFTQTLETDRAEKGTQVRLFVNIANETILPLSMMEIRFALPCPGRTLDHPICIAPYSREDFELTLDLPYRGVYEVGMKEIRITDVFGLTSIRYELKKLPWYKMLRLTVLPAVPEGYGAGEILDEKLFAQESTSQRTENVSSAREYRPGDPLKGVNWKVSARFGELFVKEYDSPARESIAILVDNTSALPEIPKKRFLRRRKKVSASGSAELAAAKADAACECAASLAQLSLSRGRLSELYFVNGEDLEPVRASDEMKMEELLLHLAEADFSMPGDFSARLESVCLETNADALIVLSANADDAMAEELAKYSDSFDSCALIAIDSAPQKAGNVGILTLPLGTDVSEILSGEAGST